MLDLGAMNIGATFPALSLALGACILLIVDLSVPKERKEITLTLSLIGVGVSFVVTLLSLGERSTAFLGMYIADAFTGLANLIILAATFVSLLIAHDYLQRTGMNRGEYYPLVLMTASGAMFMGSAGDLVTLLIALELLSIPLYVLSGFRRPDLRSEESAMKYFLLGAFSSGFLVYGIALIYGALGTTNLAEIFARVQAEQYVSPLLLLIGTALLLVGLGFKVAVVPFHLWTPDVYQGAPTPVTAYMSVTAKVGGFAALLRLMTVALPTFTVGALPEVAPEQTILVHAAWQDTVAILAALTMILGNFVAIAQRDIKRLLAYSSIAHGGYLMMAVAAAGTFTITGDEFGTPILSLSIAEEALRGALIYLAAYAFTNIGAFAVGMAVERSDATGTLLDDFAGLGRSKPFLAGAMSIFMLSLIGIPLTGGFVGKWFVFFSTLNAGLALLALIGVLTSVVSAYYYLRVIVKMWLEYGEGEASALPRLAGAIAFCTAATLIIGILPTVVASFAEGVTLALLR
ncbi:MAG: NADH-quinone oxidoreductase subunit N [Candidatus Thermofonsia Clade 1 bacterium]|uniref:NADH-quinone oxidoreductase subunit N n=1 Tax=Candidatus Thermofonsia Clade 1 bacterium TaxID=2364210 RepID=A0A2M8P090_9CHLR|nr:MAG: NADH-quinone oxidoreductase subunit N [Candidatus Thermofonsia Clade 1 bacterium]